VHVKDNRAYVNGQPLEEPYVRPGSIPAATSGHCGYLYGCDPIGVPGAYFVMGSKRQLRDGRFRGFVRERSAAAFLIYWSERRPTLARWRRLGNWLP
jgi:hypothetical protein